MAHTKLSAGSAGPGKPLCLYDENGDAIAMFSDRRGDRNGIALQIVEIINQSGGIEVVPLETVQ